MSETSNETSGAAAAPEKKELVWGTTPFDAMSRDELLRQCQRLYVATESLTSMAHLFRHGNESSPFWTEGSGGRALEYGSQALNAARDGYEHGDIYDSFFRYARDLLFTDKPGMELGGQWTICPECGQMFGGSDALNDIGQPHKVAARWGECEGIMRRVQWEDFRPWPEK